MSGITMYEPCPCMSGKKFKFCCYRYIKDGNLQNVAKLYAQHPVDLCLVSEDWKEEGIAHVLIARKTPHQNFVVALYLLDTWCLGVKSAFLRINISSRELFSLKSSIEETQPLMSVPYEDARSLILGGIAFAAQFGLTPHSDWDDTQHLLEPERTFIDKFQFGKDGKPFYVAGPYDTNKNEIIEKIQQANGHWIAPLLE